MFFFLLFTFPRLDARALASQSRSACQQPGVQAEGQNHVRTFSSSPRRKCFSFFLFCVKLIIKVCTVLTLLSVWWQETISITRLSIPCKFHRRDTELTSETIWPASRITPVGKYVGLITTLLNAWQPIFTGHPFNLQFLIQTNQKVDGGSWWGKKNSFRIPTTTATHTHTKKYPTYYKTCSQSRQCASYFEYIIQQAK